LSQSGDSTEGELNLLESLILSFIEQRQHFLVVFLHSFLHIGEEFLSFFVGHILKIGSTTTARSSPTCLLDFADLRDLIFRHFQLFLHLRISQEKSRAAEHAARAAKSTAPASRPLGESHIPCQHADRQQRQSNPEKSTHSALSFLM
jgi:hypothetical protein